jgi:hypothetical protein
VWSLSPEKKQPQRPTATLVQKPGTKMMPVEPVMPRARLKISMAAMSNQEWTFTISNPSVPSLRPGSAETRGAPARS